MSHIQSFNLLIANDVGIVQCDECRPHPLADSSSELGIVRSPGAPFRLVQSQADRLRAGTPLTGHGQAPHIVGPGSGQLTGVLSEHPREIDLLPQLRDLPAPLVGTKRPLARNQAGRNAELISKRDDPR